LKNLTPEATESKDENEDLNNWIVAMKNAGCERFNERDLKAIKELLRSSKEEICILGIVGFQPIHEARLIIRDLINNHNGTVRILIADPESGYFEERRKKEEDTVGRLRNEHKSAITELKDIYLRLIPGREHNIVIKLYNNLPGDISIQITDGREMFVSIRKEGFRDYESPMYKIKKELPGEQPVFEHFVNFFEDLWDDKCTKEISIITEPWIRSLLINTDISSKCLESLLAIAQQIAREGREGRQIGTAFLLGDASHVLRHSRQLILNPLEGHKLESRNITNYDFRETIKELAQLDGVFVITGDGIAEAAARGITLDTSGITIPRGLGIRHSAVAAITQITHAIGIDVSQSGGNITIFKNGKIVKVIERGYFIF